jgi:hypothetical protein
LKDTTYEAIVDLFSGIALTLLLWVLFIDFRPVTEGVEAANVHVFPVVLMPVLILARFLKLL